MKKQTSDKVKQEKEAFREFFLALNDIETEYRIPKESMLASIEAGLVSAYKKESGYATPITVRLNPESLSYKVYAHRVVVEDVEDDDQQILLEDAQNINPNYKVGDVVLEDITPNDFSRIAAQTAKQVILQRINDMKKELVQEEMKRRQGELVSATIRRKEGTTVFVEISGTQVEGVMMASDQIPGEKYNVGEVIKVFVKKIRDNDRNGTQVIVSRSSTGFVRSLFMLEVPEIKAGLVRIVSIAREAGFRTKIAVKKEDNNVDAVGSCIGNKGARINAIVAELGGNEKVDVIEYSDDFVEYIARSLSPAQVVLVGLNDEEKRASAIVPDEKLSLAIGRNGQNARLAAKLTGWKIDVKPYSAYQLEVAANYGEDDNN